MPHVTGPTHMEVAHARTTKSRPRQDQATGRAGRVGLRHRRADRLLAGSRLQHAQDQERGGRQVRPHYITPPIEEGLPLFGTARSSDPVTSHQAAAQAGGLATKHQRQILAALLEGPAGASGIAARAAAAPDRQADQRAGQGWPDRGDGADGYECEW